MNILPSFELLKPATIEEAVQLRRQYAKSRLLGGGTDLLVNLRRGIGDDPDALIDVTGIEEMKAVDEDGSSLRIGASVTLARLAADPLIRERYRVLGEAAGSVAGSIQQNMATVGGNLCLDTRCMFYNQSEWWRTANSYCLKYGGEKCHVAPKSKVCFATFSGDLAPALLVMNAEIEIAGNNGRRSLPLSDLYTHDGQNYLSLKPEEFICSVTVAATPGLRTAYDKIRVRRSIEFPLAGVAVALRRDGEQLKELRVAFTGTNPGPVLLEGTDALCGGGLDADGLERLDKLISRQLMSMKTTFTSGHYRRRAAGVLARRLVERLFEAV